MRSRTSPEKKGMIGAEERPYILHWPAVQYQKEGTKLGFAFTPADIQRASENGGVIGVRRYMPTPEAQIKLAIPPGSFVKCCLL